jgi:hypothetical protein
VDFEFRISERKRLILWRVVVGTPIGTHSRIRILAIDAIRILYRNFNDIGVRSFILTGAPLPNKAGRSGLTCPAAHHELFENHPASDDTSSTST